MPLCKELAELYETKIQYSKLCEILVSSLAYRFISLRIFTNITLILLIQLKVITVCAFNDNLID